MNQPMSQGAPGPQIKQCQPRASLFKSQILKSQIALLTSSRMSRSLFSAVGAPQFSPARRLLAGWVPLRIALKRRGCDTSSIPRPFRSAACQQTHLKSQIVWAGSCQRCLFRKCFAPKSTVPGMSCEICPNGQQIFVLKSCYRHPWLTKNNLESTPTQSAAPHSHPHSALRPPPIPPPPTRPFLIANSDD
jgi:hypothetical protein